MEKCSNSRKDKKSNMEAMLKPILTEHHGTDVLVRKLQDAVPKIQKLADKKVMKWVQNGGFASLCHFFDRVDFFCWTEKIQQMTSSEQEQEFSGKRRLAEESLALLEIILVKCHSQDSDFQCLPQTIVTYLPQLIILTYSFVDPLAPWSSEKLKFQSLKVVCRLLKIFKCENLDDLIQIDCSSGLRKKVEIPNEAPGTLLERVLSQLHPQLQKDTLHSNPSSVTAFTQLLVNLHHPTLSGYVSHVLPLALTIMEDYRGRFLLTGAKCISHITLTCTTEALRRNNTGLVIYDALERQYLQRHDPEVLRVIASIWMSVAESIETPSQCLYPQAPMKSKLLRTFLHDVEMEQDVSRRRVIMGSVVSMIPRMGICLVKHLKLLLTTLLRSLEVPDGESEEARTLALHALNFALLIIWPRLHCHVSNITKSLLRLLMELAVGENLQGKATGHVALHSGAVNALLMLYSSCPEEMRPVLEAVQASKDIHQDVRSAVNDVLTASLEAMHPAELHECCSALDPT